MNIHEGSELRSYDVLATYSREGPPYFELIEAIGETVWSPAMVGGLHHFGVMAADPLAEITRLEDAGFHIETQAVTPEGVVTGPTYLLNRYGVRVEVNGEAARDMVAEWVASEG